MPWYLRKLMVRGGFMDTADDNGGAGTGGGSDGGAGDDGNGGGSGNGDDGSSGSGDGGSGDSGNGDDGSGKPKPTDAEAKLLKELMGNKKKLKEVTDKLGAASGILSQLEELGGIDAIKELVSAKKKAETDELEKRGEWDRLRTQMNEDHTKKIALKDAELQQRESENATLKKTIAELTVGNAFSSSQFIKDDLTIPLSKVRVLYGSHFEYGEDGKVVAYDKPAGAAERTMLIDGKGDPLGFEESIKKIIEADPDRDSLIKSKMKPGAGSSTEGKGKPPAKTLEQATGVDRIASGLATVLGKK